MPHRLESAKRVAVGTKQTLKALQSGNAAIVYIAQDAEDRLTGPVRRLATERRLPVVEVPSMAQLGRLCRIEVGAAAVAILDSGLAGG